MSKERSSNFELLRLLCIFGILVMHTLGSVDTTGYAGNLLVQVFCNSLFNTGVTCFILISGYFGIRFNLRKLIQLDMMIIFFTVAGNLLIGEASLKVLIKSCIPVISRQYWFISCYFVLCILAPFLNQIPEKLEQQQFRHLLAILLLVFSVIPTFTTYDIMQDAGKGLVDFIMVYLLGRYLALYHREPHSTRPLILGLVCSIAVVFLLDGGRSFASNLIYTTFARDCSIFIIFASVLLLLIFRNLSFQSLPINRAASNVLAIYVLDSFLRTFFQRYFDLNAYVGTWFFIFIVFAYVAVVMLLAILLNELRKCTIGRIEPMVSNMIATFLEDFWHRLQMWTDTLLKYFIH